MALRDQPYIPLYVQDVLTDEKLIECSIEAHGFYFRLICVLHKQSEYGKICLKQKYKQCGSKFLNFATMFNKQMPFLIKEIEAALIELGDEGVLFITENELWQKRMVKDGKLSLVRVEAGKKGGSNVTKQYGKKGFLYLMSDFRNLNKIGISVNPQNRLYRIRSDNKLKSFEIIETIEVVDMGKAEDFAIKFYGVDIDGEWIKKDFEYVKEKFDLLKAKIQANPKPNSENESDSVIEGVNISFNLFWDTYDKKIGKRSKLESKWNKLKDTDRELIMEYIPRYKKNTPDKQFRKNPEVFLNNESWNDELVERTNQRYEKRTGLVE